MKRGKVKWFDKDKGYGFIKADDGTSDVFIHISEVTRAGYDSLNPDMDIDYEISKNKQGKVQGINLRII